MRHHDYRSAFVELIQILNYCSFVFGIEGICGFIQEYEIRILIDCTGYEDALFLSLAQPDSVTSDNSVIF